MFEEPTRSSHGQRSLRQVVSEPAWWAGVAAVTVLVVTSGAISVTTMTFAGLGMAIALLVTAETRHRNHSFAGAAIASLGVPMGAVAVQVRAGVLTVDQPFVWVVWAGCFAILAAAAAQIAISTRRLIIDGRLETERLVISEREALEAELIVQQQKLEPELVLRAMTVIADQAQTAPRDAERAVERLAAFLRKSLTTAPVISAPLTEEVTRAQEYEEVLAAGGVNVPVAWTIDQDVREVELPGGTLRAFLDYAISRCLRTPGSAITIRASQHAKRFYLIVKDTAEPDPPMLAEPEGIASLRRRLGAPPKRRVRVETSVMFEVDGTSSGTTQTLVLRLPEAV